MYCISHFNYKNIFAHMGELGLTLDRKDFAANGYAVDEEKYPKSAIGLRGV